MAKCVVTLNVAKAGVPYVSESLRVFDAIARDDGTYWNTTEVTAVPLANSPLSTVSLDQGVVYGMVTPDGNQFFKLIPTLAAANFTALVDVVPVSVSPGYLADNVMAAVAADVDGAFRVELDVIYAHQMTGTVADGAVGALINSGTATKDALGDEMTDPTSPLALAAAAKFGPGGSAGTANAAIGLAIILGA